MNLGNRYAGKNGFTLLEVLIAAALLSMLMIVTYNTFIGSSDSFNAGNWRVHSQKHAQIVLNAAKEYLEKANYAQVVSADGVVASEAQPLYIGPNFNGKQQNTLTTSQPILFFSMSEPYVAAQPKLGITAARQGKWSGVSMYCRNGVVTLKRTSNWSRHNAPFGAPADTHPDTYKTNFDDNTAGKDMEVSVPDVVDVGVYVQSAAGGGMTATSTMIEIVLNLARIKNGKPTATTITEKIKAKLLDRNHRIRAIP
jgi:prepilin-type N-terminal cleavage/methylation domain-containing protein